MESRGAKLEEYIAEEEGFLRENDINSLTDLLKIRSASIEFLSDIRQKIAISKIPEFVSFVKEIKGDDNIVIYCYQHGG